MSDPASRPTRAARWLSRDIGALIRAQTLEPVVYDLVIVGSGYGGAMAAAELAGCQVPDENHPGQWRRARICILERGREYLPGAFPSRLAELPRAVRFKTADGEAPKGEMEALFDVRVGKDVSVLLANGLGGGSLINGAVMEKPAFGSFQSHLPQQVEKALQRGYLQAAKVRLGATRAGHDNSVALHASQQGAPPRPLKKTEALKTLDPARFRLAALTIEMQGAANAQGVQLNACTLCGDCMTGCNVGARESLDTNLLVQAQRQGAEIYTEASVLRLHRHRDGWEVMVVPTPPALRHREQQARREAGEADNQAGAMALRARRVVLAAGALGSTEILLRSKSQELAFSSRLGQRFSCNGDNLSALYKHRQPTGTVADETEPFDGRQVGPTITGIVDAVAADDSHRFLIQEFAVPAPLKRLFEEIVTTSDALHAMVQPDLSRHRPGQPARQDPCAIDDQAMGHTALLGLIGHDSASGAVRLPKAKARAAAGVGHQEGMAWVDWPEARWSAHLDQAHARLEQLANGGEGAPKVLGPGGRVLPNPMWRMLPKGLEFLVSQGRGPVLTVHPLGGCAMGRSAMDGVVDELGRVFDGRAPHSATPFDSSLVVLDGAILPGSLGANPALTIAALALRSARRLRRQWQWKRPPSPTAASHPAAPRPVYRTPAESFSQQRQDTALQIVERLTGEVPLSVPGTGDTPHVAELTLHFAPQTLVGLTRTMGRRIPLTQGPGQTNTLRLFAQDHWAHGVPLPDGRRGRPLRLADDEQRQAAAVLVATVDGELRLLDRKSSGPLSRMLRGLGAWFFNRGLRDLWQRVTEPEAVAHGAAQQPSSGWQESLRNYALGVLKIASRAGEQRVFDYRLTLTKITQGAEGPLGQRVRVGAAVHGEKCLSYGRRANPWQQLSRVRLRAFPGARWLGFVRQPWMLALDTRFLARQGVPLLQITRQQDQPTALADMASLALYMLRLVLSVHLWSFRKPDTAPPQTPQRLPGCVPGLPPPQVTELDLDPQPSGLPVRVRLTRYERRGSARPPLVFIHGYSASGTNFAHPAIQPCLASHFWHQDCDVWVLDLRTSSGMPTAHQPWAFEDAAFADIPVAIAHIVRVTGQPKVDVFAHCIGAVMLSMALLTGRRELLSVVSPQPPIDGAAAPTVYADALEVLPSRIRRIVLSQKGPVLNYTDDNIFRAYTMRHLRRLLLPDRYRFRPTEPASVQDQLLDRLLATLPYPEDEFDRENPPPWRFWRRTPWTTTRHRMDALYARDFNLANIADPTLRHIDDFFGPLNLDTVAQAIHFARYSTITNSDGRRLSLDAMAQRWGGIPTLSVHGANNGLVDKATLDSMSALMAQQDVPFQTLQVEGYGHQDCLIGQDAATRVFAPVNRFLRDDQGPSC